MLLGQPDDIRAFLLQTSVLDRFCATLCDAVTERDDSRRILRELESSNFFLVPLDTKRDWYRYHHLFRDLLRMELELIHPEQLTALHRRAHAWHRDVDSAAGRDPSRDCRRRHRRGVGADPEPLAGEP